MSAFWSISANLSSHIKLFSSYNAVLWNDWFLLIATFKDLMIPSDIVSNLSVPSYT